MTNGLHARTIATASFAECPAAAAAEEEGGKTEKGNLSTKPMYSNEILTPCAKGCPLFSALPIPVLLLSLKIKVAP